MDWDKLLSEFYIGECFNAYLYFGAHPCQQEGIPGVLFRVYAPNAISIQVIGEFNQWRGDELEQMGQSGVFSRFIPNAQAGQMYKYRVQQGDGRTLDKADPYAFGSQLRPESASIVVDLDQFQFSDQAWLERRNNQYKRPMNIYELHLGSWRRKENGEWYTYEELAEPLIQYLLENRFTHVEFLPVMEHPFDGSWGYQVSGFYSATARYGTPCQLMSLIDQLHQHNLGVILDFVPVHFVLNDYALARFDGTPLYEYPDTDTGYSQWGSHNFNYYRGEVRSFLQSAANFWVERFHADGLRMDAVNNALYWQGNPARGVNPGAVEFLKGMNAGLHRLHNGLMLMAEDSSNFPKVTAPVEYGGLGFDYKWDMGWMNDTLSFFEKPFSSRHALYHQLTFSMDYFYNELYLLPLSHDEVVHGKKTIVDKMHGTYEEKFAQARALYIYMYTHPGKKLNFMGNELGHFREWDEEKALDWNLLDYPIHDSLHRYLKELGRLYQTLPALYTKEYHSGYFQWLKTNAQEGCVYAYQRGQGPGSCLILLNLGKETYQALKVDILEPFSARELLNSDALDWAGSGLVHPTPLSPRKLKKGYRLELSMAPLSACVFQLEEPEKPL